MSLIVYTDENSIIQAGIDLIRINDLFFNTETNLCKNELTDLILSEIDKARFNSELTFIGRTEDIGALNKNMLSTGTKTLLNITSYPDKCFDVCECGDNALSILPLITDGHIYWRKPIVAYLGDPKCDIVCDGRTYTDFYEFLESVGE